MSALTPSSDIHILPFVSKALKILVETIASAVPAIPFLMSASRTHLFSFHGNASASIRVFFAISAGVYSPSAPLGLIS